MKPRRRRSAENIRSMRLSEMEAVWRLGHKAFSQEAPYTRRMWTEAELLASFSNDPELCVVASSKGRVLGFAIGELVARSGSPWHYGFLKWLAVAPRSRRRGVAWRLYRALERRMRRRGARALMCDVETENVAALSFFKGQGFREDKTVAVLWKSLEA